MDGQVTQGPLSGILVVDFSQAEAGPIATQVLADFGARVLKIEKGPEGELLRKDWGHEANGFYLPFATLNRGKESICLDVRHPRGKEVVERLLQAADLVVHNFRPGVMERLGLGYEQLHERYPRLIYAEASGFGPWGPLAHKGGQDILAQAIGGAMWQNSPDGQRPLPLGYPVADFSSGMGVLSGVLMALYNRERTGQGAKVQTSLLEGLAFSMLQEMTEAMSGYKLTQGNDPLAGVFAAGDGYLVVMPIWRPDAVEQFLDVLGLNDLLTDPRMATAPDRQANNEWVREQVECCLRTDGVNNWLAKFDERNLLCAPVLRMEDAYRHEQVQAVNPFVPMYRSDGTQIGTGVRPHIRFNGQVGAASVVPGPGEQTGSVLTELGFSAEEVAALFETGVVTGTRPVSANR